MNNERKIPKFSDEVCEMIKNRGREILSHHKNRLKDKITELKYKEPVRDYESDPIVFLILADEINSIGFVEITCQDAQILCAFSCNGANVFMPNARRCIKNSASPEEKQTWTKEVHSDFVKEIDHLRSMYYGKWVCIYTDPVAKFKRFSLQLYFWNILFGKVMDMRLKGDTTNLLHESLELPHDGGCGEDEGF